MEDNGRPEALTFWGSLALKQLNEGIDLVFDRVQIPDENRYYPVPNVIKHIVVHFVAIERGEVIVRMEALYVAEHVMVSHDTLDPAALAEVVYYEHRQAFGFTFFEFQPLVFLLLLLLIGWASKVSLV